MITVAEYNKAKAAVEKAYTSDSIKAYTDSDNAAKSSGASSSQAFSSSKGLLVGNSSSGSSSGTSGSSGSYTAETSTSAGGTSTNTTSTSTDSLKGLQGKNVSSENDIYGDVSKNPTTNKPMDFTFQAGKTLTPELDKYGAEAISTGMGKSGQLAERNDIIASNLYEQGKYTEQDVKDFLNTKTSFQNASEEDQANTIRAITARLSAITKQQEGDTTADKSTVGLDTGLTEEDIANAEGSTKDGYYKKSDGTYDKIYGYNVLDEEYQNQIDNLSDSDKKYISNLMARGYQDMARTYLDNKRLDKQLKERQDINEELYNINRQQSLIQAQQTLRHAQESYDNLKQNWQYLGNMGMPGTSATRIQAIGDAISEAHTTLGEIQKLTQLSLDAQEKQREGEVLQYTQQIENLQYQLDWQVNKEIQGMLGKYSVAELEGKLDTVDGITAFKKELLDDLDSNLSGITSASLEQMQYVTKQYQDMADKLYKYAENKNVVNKDMSAVQGYYVDGNGNAILNSKGETIEVPKQAPFEPMLDKNSGQLITFEYAEDGSIKANVQQLWDAGTDNVRGNIINALRQGYSITDIMSAFPNADYKMVQDLAEIIKPDNTSTTRQGPSYNTVSQGTIESKIGNFISEHPVNSHGGECAKFVNDFLEKAGVGRIFGNEDIKTRERMKNSSIPQEGSIAIFDYNHLSSDGVNHGHVALITNVNRDGSFDIIESNYPSGGKVGTRHIEAGDKNLRGFFNPTKSADQYNTEQKWSTIDTLSQEDKKNLETVAYLINNYPGRDALNAASTKVVGGVVKYLDQNVGTYMGKLNSILSNLQLNAKQRMGSGMGQISDSDMRILREASTTLDPTMSEDEYVTELKNIFNAFVGNVDSEFTVDEISNRYGGKKENTGLSSFLNVGNRINGNNSTNTGAGTVISPESFGF